FEGRFTTHGKTIELHANLPPEPHAIHGHGWQATWKIEAQSEASITLLYRHETDAWPWDYEARQTFTLDESALMIALTLSNHSDAPMPAGLGWHPYFEREGAELLLATTSIWQVDEETGRGFPEAVTNDTDLSQGQQAEHLLLDHSFDLIRNSITLTWPTHTVHMESDPIFGKATVYVPAEQSFFCVEPISHAPNAMNSALSEAATGLKWLGKGEQLSGTIKLSVDH
ncbi:MAG: hypothetical protein AAGB16_02655, partial [Pseudomonadota bacterium]